MSKNAPQKPRGSGSRGFLLGALLATLAFAVMGDVANRFGFKPEWDVIKWVICAVCGGAGLLGLFLNRRR